MKYLNLGCGTNYLNSEVWTNVDFVSTAQAVLAHNLLDGIPFIDDSFDLVYHSHVLEHFTREDGEILILECFRVLKPGGVLRIAVPDLEEIARNYLKRIEEGLKCPSDNMIRADYDWMLLEMYDQTVRNQTGGEMAKYLFQEKIRNEEFVYERIGEEGKLLRKNFLKLQQNSSLNRSEGVEKEISISFIPLLKSKFKKYLLQKLKVDEKALSIGSFRLGGEIHQWMYDRYSLYDLLKNKGGQNIQVRDAFNSFINNWSEYNLDGKDGIVRKPDSLFIEAIK